MESNRKNLHISKEIINLVRPIAESEVVENLNYLYPNGHRITHQMRWYKGSRDRGLKTKFTM